jgi:hypothetical protein
MRALIKKTKQMRSVEEIDFVYRRINTCHDKSFETDSYDFNDVELIPESADPCIRNNQNTLKKYSTKKYKIKRLRKDGYCVHKFREQTISYEEYKRKLLMFGGSIIVKKDGFIVSSGSVCKVFKQITGRASRNNTYSLDRLKEMGYDIKIIINDVYKISKNGFATIDTINKAYREIYGYNQ